MQRPTARPLTYCAEVAAELFYAEAAAVRPLAGVPRLRRLLCSLFFLLLSSALCSVAVVVPCSTVPLLSLSPPALSCPFLPCCCARTTALPCPAPALFPRSALALSHAKRRREEREGMTGGPNLAVRGKGLTDGVVAGLLCENHGRMARWSILNGFKT